MPDVQLHPKASNPLRSTTNPLPQLLQTPSGLALLELQGTINLPAPDEEDMPSADRAGSDTPRETAIGRLVFPEYDPQNTSSTGWMKRVYMYVGKHQRLTGEVKKLPKAIAVIRKRRNESAGDMDVDMNDEGDEEGVAELEVVEIVKYKIIFSTRPEPVGALVVGAGDGAGQ
ncbi:related to sister chromatid cohesion protein Ctf8 [Phialocephala subalpina]|uniref:Related to sister chromatid cohesion protein Ctf8 n=1 Tax=Phialocephala subalpina TaxID=576137 RepID=A0A1L7WIM0_9HELO|nr:related to sister chromatid cohesion protein Ctf8 [Phialocephala subalpina]